MLYREENHLGSIKMDEGVIDDLIRHALSPFEGRVWLANYKGTVSDVIIKVTGLDSLAEREISYGSEGVFIRLYLVYRFGISIKETSRRIFEELAYGVEKCLELALDDIEIVLTGMASKHISKRNIVIRYRGGHFSGEGDWDPDLHWDSEPSFDTNEESD